MAKAAKAKPAPEAEAPEVTAETPKKTKTQAVRGALKANPKKPPKEIATMLQAEGWDVKAQMVSVVKSHMKGKRKKAKAAPVPEAAGPVVPKDAVSIGLLQKAKKLASQFSNIKEAKAAIDALAQILD